MIGARTATIERRFGASCSAAAVRSARSVLATVLFVADVLEPVDRLAVERFLDGDVRHCRCRRCTVPVFFSGLEPDHVARANLLDSPALALDAPEASRDHERLAERMGMPRCAGTGLERH